jgi:hypothetical protein
MIDTAAELSEHAPVDSLPTILQRYPQTLRLLKKSVEEKPLWMAW